MNHQQLTERALRWLRNTLRCNPAYSGNASCAEIPDAIGWSSFHKFNGSIVIECKTSVADFYRDQQKRFYWKHPNYAWRAKVSRMTAEQAKAEGYELLESPRMGDFRFFMCEPGVLTPEHIQAKAPDHGLLCVHGRTVKIVVSAPRRATLVDYPNEVRYLRFAVVNWEFYRRREIDRKIQGELKQKNQLDRLTLEQEALVNVE